MEAGRGNSDNMFTGNSIEQLLEKCCVVREGLWYDVGLILLFIRNVEGLADLSHQSIIFVTYHFTVSR